MRHEIRRKYDLDHSDVVERLRAFGRIDWARVAELEDALDRRDHDAALERLLGILEALQTLILRAGPTEAVESIYHKRHIAAGIPSMYGSYREERFEAIGLSFRLESLATALLERVIDDGAPTALDRQRLTRIAGWLRLLLRAHRRLPRPGLGTASRCSTRRSRARGPASTSTSTSSSSSRATSRR